MAIKNIQTSHLVHDLKNPVNIIESGARSLLDKQDRYGELTPKQEKVVRRVMRNALKIKTLVASMLEVDMATKGLVKVQDCTPAHVIKSALLEVFDLVDPRIADALEEAKDLPDVRQVLQANHVTLEGEDDHLNGVIRTDETKFCLIITNLLSNALKYKKRFIHLTCMNEGGSCRVSVQDDGPGIPVACRTQVFDQYFQCVGVEGFPVRGHGLGLAGAQALSEALGGNLSIGDSSGGAEFIVQILSDLRS